MTVARFKSLALILYKNNIKQLRNQAKNLEAQKALILYKNNIKRMNKNTLNNPNLER